MPKRNNTTKLTARQRLGALSRVVKISYAAAPSVLYTRVVSAILDSVLPLATTFFAARTTTELARAYNGEAGASQAAITFVALTALLGVLTAAWSRIESYLTELVRYKLQATVTEQLLSRFLALEFWRYDDKETADALDKARRFSTFFTHIFDTLGSVLTSIVTLFASIVALIFVSWWLALLVIAAVVPGIIIQYKLSKARTEHWANNIDTRRKYMDIEWQLLQPHSIAEIRLYGLVQPLLNLYQKYRDQDEKQQIKIERRFAGKEFLASFVEALAEVVALIYVTLQIIAQAMPIGQFLYVQQIVSRALGTIRGTTSSLTNIDEDLANLSAYDSFMDLPIIENKGTKITATPDTISLQSVSFTYPKTDRAVLEDVTLLIKKGEHIAIVGENGAGKSTLVKLLLGFYEPTSGSVLIDDTPTLQLNLESWHRQIGVLQQSSLDYEYVPLRDNILFGDMLRPFSQQRYEQAIDRAEAKEFIDKLPKQDATYISRWMDDEDGTSGVELSGGQKQRLALARSFYRDSPVVILDEPTSAIDALAESRIFKRLFEEKDKTIITISHRLSTVRRADRIYVIENGKIVEQGRHDELVASKGVYFTLFESQI